MVYIMSVTILVIDLLDGKNYGESQIADILPGRVL